MSDYDSIMSDADDDRIYNKELDIHNRDAHDYLTPPTGGCLVCEDIAAVAEEEDSR